MASPKQKTIAAIVAGVLVAVAPSFFAYLQARQEIRSKYNTTHANAEAGYDTLVLSVEKLQQALIEQHDHVVKLEGQVFVLTSILPALMPTRGPASTTMKIGMPPQLPINPRPEFPPAPDFDAIQKQ
jgi:hypothetical protein